MTAASPSANPPTEPVVDSPDQLRALAELVAASRRIVAFTGAGISTESGIPDYRGPGGVWERNAPPTIGDFLENPETRQRYWENRLRTYPDLLAREPNAGHRALYDLDRDGRLAAVVTQNIDGLHQKAGHAPEQVIELHGTAHRVRCTMCGTTWDGLEIQARLERGDLPPACPVCGGIMRTATILFGESLPVDALNRAVAAAREADLMLVVGSSLVVQPAARLPLVAKQAGAKVVIVNRMTTPLDAIADLRLFGDAGPTLSAAVAAGS